MRIVSTFILLLLFLAISNTPLLAQSKSIEVIGTILEYGSKQPVEFATVMLTNKETQQAIKGVTTGIDGKFALKTDAKDFHIKISFIGFQPQTIDEYSIVEGKIDLGEVYLSENSETLDEVIVRAEKSQTVFKLDKRVFNVGKDLSSTGASVLEVLNNVPSVNVNIEGQISLRGSTGVQILINGKPSVLANEGGNALGTITADMIDRIEVITNPSAKYDAEGTSGIINIVIKKEERKGMNGSITLNTGIPHNHSFGLSLNRRTEKFNLFSQLGVGYREMPTDVGNINRDLRSDTTTISNGTEYRNENFYNLILGTDYHINKNNVLTLSGYFALELEDQPSQTEFSIFDENDELVSQWNRQETTTAVNPKFQYELQYKSDFEDHEDHMLLFSALGNFFGKDQSSDFVNTTVFGEGPNAEQDTRTDFKEAVYTFKLDYTKPFSKEWKMETGAQYVMNDVSNDFEVNDLINGEWIQDIRQTNIFEFDQKVLGVYTTGAYEGDKWGLKLGVRLENTNVNTFLVTSGEDNDQNYTNLFPSAHTSYKVTENFSLQAGYSRRIYRPRMWDLNPFFNIRNPLSIRVGNPNLQPEFTDSYEISSIFIFDKASFNFGIYHLYTTEVIERVPFFEDNVRVTSPSNIGTNRATGVEFNTKYTPLKWLSINGDFNFNYFNREGSLLAEGRLTSFDFTGNRWNTKWTAKLELPLDIDLEMTGHYESSFINVRSEIADNLFADLGVRAKILKGKGSLNLSIRDLFASRIQKTITDQPDFFLYGRRFRGRFITIGISYGFGKGEAMEFSGEKRRGSGGGRRR